MAGRGVNLAPRVAAIFSGGFIALLEPSRYICLCRKAPAGKNVNMQHHLISLYGDYQR